MNEDLYDETLYREKFVESFYFFASIDDRDSGQPWGCPWYWISEKDYMKSGDPEKDAFNWWMQYKEEIEELERLENEEDEL